MHGVVAGVEEDPAPQVGDAVGVAFLDSDQAAALADAGQVLFADAVLDSSGEDRQDGQGEQGLQGAGGREFAVCVVGGQDFAGPGVRDQPGEGGDIGYAGGARAGSDLGVRCVQECGWGCGRAGIRPGVGCRRGGGEREDAREAEGAGRHGDPGWESDCHTANVETAGLRKVLAGPCGASQYPGCASARPGRPSRGSWGNETQVSQKAAWGGSGAGTSRCPGWSSCAPAGFPCCPGRPSTEGLGASPVPLSTRPG